MEFFTLSPLILSTLVPNASISGIGFAFPNYDTVWKAMDGDLGAYVRGQITKANLVVMDKIWDNGFRQITSSTKPIKRPTTSRASRSACRSGHSGPRCSPPSVRRRPASTSRRSIPRCRPRSSTVRRIRWPSSRPAKLYEVQKYVSMTNHMWDGFWFLANRRAWERLPEDLRDVVAKHINAAAVEERADVAKLNATV